MKSDGGVSALLIDTGWGGDAEAVPLAHYCIEQRPNAAGLRRARCKRASFIYEEE